MSCLIPRSFQKESWRKLAQSDQWDSLSTKSLLGTKNKSESDTTHTRNTLRNVRNHSNTTVLGRLIFNRKYDAALRRLKKAPLEASIWIVGGTTHPGSVPSRQLPIHMACSALSTCHHHDIPSRTQLELLIRQLALAFPAGCTHRDSKQRLPLHKALRHNASLDTISMLLIVAPETIDDTDRYGRLPYEITGERMGDHKDEITPLLRKDKHFWRAKREEFFAQSPNGTESYLIKNLLRLNCVLGGRPTGKDYATILSQESELLTPGRFDEKTQVFDRQSDPKSFPKEPSKPRLHSGESSDDHPKILQEIRRLQALKTEYTRALADENLAKRVVKLEREKSEMRLRLNQMVCVLNKQGLTPGDGRGGISRGDSGLRSMMAQTEDSTRSIRCGESFKKPVFTSKFSVREKKHRSSRLTRSASRAIKEEAMRDIVFVPNDFAHVDNGGLAHPGTAFQRSLFTKCFTPGNPSSYGAYDLINVEAQGTLENLLDMAELRFGHTFSPGTIEAWRQISLPDSANETHRGPSH